MNKKVLIVKNISREGPGLLGTVLNNKSIPFDVINLWNGQKISKLRHYSALFVLGGPDSANDQTPKMKEQLKIIKEAVAAEIPYFGICLGMQTLVKAYGGEVIKSKVKEVGFRDPNNNYFEIELTENGKKDPIFKEIKSPFKIFQLHGETVKINGNTTLLATGKYCKNQIIKIGKNAYGMQGHLEITHDMLEKWSVEDDDLKNVDTASLFVDYNKIKDELDENGRQLFTNFLEIANISGRIVEEAQLR